MRTINRALPQAVLKEELGCHQRPVVFGWHDGPVPGAGHMMVAYGYDGDFIEILDPWPPCEGQTRLISYDEYVNGNNPGTSNHWHDFFRFAPLQTP